MEDGAYSTRRRKISVCGLQSMIKICHYGNVSLQASEISDSVVEFQGTYSENGADCS